MPDIVIPEEKFEEFLRSLLVCVTKEREKLVAEMRADVEASEALFHARLEEALARRTRAHEEELEKKLRAAEDEIARLLERLRRTVEAEREPEALARLLECLRQTAAVERGERPQ